MTDWVEHPGHGPDLYYRREGRTVHVAGRDVAHPPARNTAAETAELRDAYTEALGAWDLIRFPLTYEATAPTTKPGGTPVIHVSAEATAPSKRMTLAELAAFVDQAKTAGVPDTAGLNVTSKGLGHLRKITTEDGAE